ncbi:hypothetical protein RM96_23220 [Cupriavidus sp. IDO]|nr:hypothetical protein RM96_23220 [Cupriavidus sp. IDO]
MVFGEFLFSEEPHLAICTGLKVYLAMGLNCGSRGRKKLQGGHNVLTLDASQYPVRARRRGGPDSRFP